MKDTNTIRPPALAKRFLHAFLREELAEEVEGDLEEKFLQLVEEKSVYKAKINYWYQVIHYLRPFAIKKNTYTNPNSFAMFDNYFKVGWRNLSKHKLYSSIKIGGLALSIASCLLIALFIQHELSYDQHYPDVDRIYRVVGASYEEEVRKGTSFPAPLADALRADFPQIEKAGRILPNELFGAGNKEIRLEGKVENYFEQGFVFADQELLEILQPEIVYGELKTALSEPKSIAISRSKSEKYFGKENPVGQILVLDNDEDEAYTIRAVFEDFPDNSHLHFDFLMTMSGLEFYPGEQTNWNASNYDNYILIQAHVNADSLADKLTKGIIDKYVLPEMRKANLKNAEEFAKTLRIELQPIQDIHLHSSGIRDGLQHGDIRFVWLFGIIAIFILIIACINFINLSTAKSANRAKEVGLRKVVGSLRKHLVRQFLTESVLFSLIGFVIAIFIAVLLMPYFNSLSGKDLSIPWFEWRLYPLLIALAIFIGILAGIYPSFYLSSFRPIQVLKGSLSRGSKSSKMRSTLVVVQFTISIVLIISTVTIYRQMNFILNKELGFDKEQVLVIQGTGTLGEQIQTFKKELESLPQVQRASISDYLPVDGFKMNSNGFWKEGKVNIDKPVYSQIWRVDHDYIETLGMKVLEGRDFTETLPSDSQKVIVNEEMIKQLELEQPLGATITNSGQAWEVIGIVEDFHFESFKGSIRPLCLVLGNSPTVVSVKVAGSEMQKAIAGISDVWLKFSPHQDLRYTFLDDSFAMMYDDVLRMGKIFTSFAVLAIIIACLGLFALSAFMVEQRTKEISIRLVLGASLNNIFRILTQNFLLLIVISLLIASPIAWYLMQRWLADYEYRITISWDVFVMAGIVALLIAVFTISYQSLKAALINPVNKLRTE
ncbi:ABC transporter permease [Porifericola rhodea]|uniref:FtsX-like permease family protein n=1 Tax=Porifericola rhodea TaxID=930972 RepID=UPI002665496D|nr:ABC transporter permease [Porifericola rhodea]WKN30661.1 ABC transporter permease [Porifericola rhodea]